MTKKEIISYLVKEWIRQSPDDDTRKQRFINHDMVENKFNRQWTKEGVKWAYDLYVCESWNIENIIDKFVWLVEVL